MDTKATLNKALFQKGSISSINWIKVIIVTIVLFIFGCMAFYTGHKFPIVITNNNNTPTTSNTIIDPYSGWQSYSNTSQQLSFKYPANWSLVSTPSVSTGIKGKICNGIDFTLMSPEGYNIYFSYGLDNCVYGGSEPGLFVNYKQIQINGQTLYDAYIDECSANPETQDCMSTIVDESIISNLSAKGLSGEHTGGGYITLNGRLSMIDLSLDISPSNGYLYNSQQLNSIDNNFDLFLNSIKFPSSTYGTPTPTVVSNNNKRTTTFTGLGISFTFDTQDVNNDNVEVHVIGNKIYFGEEPDPQSTGLYIEIFSKSPTDSIQTSITKTVLSGYNLSDCPIIVSSPPRPNYPSTFETATLNYASDNQAIGVGPRDSSKCPINYAPIEQDKYFLVDTQHPDKLLFFSRGQFSEFSWGDNLTIQ